MKQNGGGIWPKGVKKDKNKANCSECQGLWTVCAVYTPIKHYISGTYLHVSSVCFTLGKGDVVLESKVVLTKIKIFNNFHERLSGAEDSFSTISISASEQDMSEPSRILDESLVLGSPENKPPEPKSEYLSVFPDSQITRLFKFEYEDSGVEMPSGADSPSTPTGSEQSFVVHSRESSHSLEDMSTLAPASNPLLLLERCPMAEEMEDSLHLASEVKEHDLTTLEARVSLKMTPVQATPLMEGTKMQQSETEALRDTSKELEDAAIAEAATEEPLEEGRIVRSYNSTEAHSTPPDVDLQEEPLKKSLSMDSLDTYMDECCRLSEVRITPLSIMHVITLN